MALSACEGPGTRLDCLLLEAAPGAEIERRGSAADDGLEMLSSADFDERHLTQS
jgi:hypothetical protein